MGKIHGRNLIVKADGTAIACARSCEVDIDTDVQEIADPTSGAWTKYRTGKKSWTVTVSGLLDATKGVKVVTDLVGTEVTLVFMNATSGNSETLTGSAIVKSAKLTGTIQNLAQYSATFQGNGVIG